MVSTSVPHDKVYQNILDIHFDVLGLHVVQPYGGLPPHKAARRFP